MDRETINRIYENELTPKQKKVLPLFLAGYSDDDIIRELQASDRTLITQHLRNICKKFCIFPEQDTDYRHTLVELFFKNKPEIVSPKRLKMSGLMGGIPPFPDSPNRADSPFYIERNPTELNCYKLITQTGTLLRIKSPQKMGKTSLLRKIISEAKQKKYYTVMLNLSLIETSKFTSIEQFLLTFYNYIIQELPSVPPLKDWDKNTSVIINCTKDFQNLLKHLNKEFVLILDDVDQLFKYPDIYQDFFPMLRHWYEKTNESEIWEKLRLIISHSTDDYGKLGINQSPFNVGIPIKLEEFNFTQIQTLAFRHGLGQESISKLIDLVGGHPYLLRLAFYYLYYQQISLLQLLEEATTNQGIYQDYLQNLLQVLQDNLSLKTVFKNILSQQKLTNFREKTIEIYQLEGMGLIKFEHNSFKVSCKLYQQYFGDRL